MRKLFFLFSFVLISFISFSQKISLNEFTAQNWDKIYEDNSVDFFYKLYEGSAAKTYTNSFVLFKISNKQNTAITLNVNIVLEYYNYDEIISRNKTIIIPANTTISEKYNGENLRVPLTKRKDSNKKLKSIKLDF